MNNSTSESENTQTNSSNTVTVHVSGTSREQPFSKHDDFELMAKSLPDETDVIDLSSPQSQQTNSADTASGVALNRRSIIMSGVAALLASFAGSKRVSAQETSNEIDFEAQDAIGLSHTRSAEDFRLSKSSQLTVEEVQGATEDEVLEVSIDIAPKGESFASVTGQKFTPPGAAAEAASDTARSVVEKTTPGQGNGQGSPASNSDDDGGEGLVPSGNNVVKKGDDDDSVEQSSLGHIMRFHAAETLAPSERDLTQHHDKIELDDFHIDASIEELTKRENRIIAHDYDIRVQLLGSGGTVITSETQTITVEYGLNGGPGVRFAYNPLLVAPTDDTRSLTSK